MPESPPDAPPFDDDCRGGVLRPGEGAAGFTLMELLVVSVIIGTLAAIAVPRLSSALDLASVAAAIAEVRSIELTVMDFELDNGRLPTTLAEAGLGGLLDPWGNPYQYLTIAGQKGKGAFRKDKFLVPLNSDFDLYSMGADGKSNGPLSAKASQDDVLRANDGGFVGLAADY